ncbi:translation machinery-associated protein 16 [Globomyces pollinis-pini]|nr:translation machinery-associated protein 16 [Globomyces pollinis-pini]
MGGGTTNNKVKKMKNIKGLSKAHPYSRKATQMKRVLMREDSTAHKEQLRNEPKQRAVDKLLWFKNASEEFETVTIDDLHDLVLSYIERNDPEILELKAKLRKGRPRPNRLDNLEMLKSTELGNYKIGFEVPNLTNPDVFKSMKKWEGDYNAIDTLTTIRIKQSDAIIKNAMEEDDVKVCPVVGMEHDD